MGLNSCIGVFDFIVNLRVGAVAEAAEGEQQLQERGLPHQAQGHHT